MSNDDIYPGFVPLTPSQLTVMDLLHGRRWQLYAQQQWLRQWYNVARVGALTEGQAVDAIARLRALDAEDSKRAAERARGLR